MGDSTGSRPTDQARILGLGGPRFDPDRELVQVTQADREAAAELGRWSLRWLPEQVQKTLEGRGDEYPIVQVLARHRLAHQQPARYLKPDGRVG